MLKPIRNDDMRFMRSDPPNDRAQRNLRSAATGLATAFLSAFLFLIVFTPSAQAMPVQSLLASTQLCPKQNAVHERPRAQERAMRCLINRARARSGLARLTPSRPLTVSARLKSSDIRRCHSFSHNACGRDFLHWIKRVGYAKRCWSAAENIAWGIGQAGSPRRILASWLNSPAHRAAILSQSYAEVGVGVKKAGNPRRPGSQTWTAHFGRRC